MRLPDWFQMVDRRAAETQLKNSLPGKFIIRPTTRGKDGEFSVSVKYKKPGDVHHFKLIRDTGNSSWTMWGQKFATLQEFVKHFQKKAIAKKGPEQICLDKNAKIEVILVENDQGMDTYYGNGVDEEETYDNGTSDEESEEDEEEESDENPSGSRDEEYPEFIEGSVVRCTYEFVPEEEGTIYMRPGDRLVVLYPPTEEWVYVKGERGEEGYVPVENVEPDRR